MNERMNQRMKSVSIDDLNKIGAEYLPGYLGIEMLALDEAMMRSRMPVKALHFAPNGFLDAASIIALADTTCGYVTMAHLPDGAESFTTIELKVPSRHAARRSIAVLWRPHSTWVAILTSACRDRRGKRQEDCAVLAARR